MNYVYILECADDTLYTGWTNDLQSRIAKHNNGKGAKYTRNRRPVKLFYCEEYDTKQEAMKREWQIKQLTRQEKLKLKGG
ncbi:MAG: GIY-YIG nuclease family protein [Oscillospiraceae bacterium]